MFSNPSYAAWRTTTCLIFLAMGVVPDPGPQPPCGGETFPSYANSHEPPVTKFWDGSGLGRDWTPPACTGWTSRGFETLTAVAARFRNSTGMESMRARIGAISEMKGLLYWSTTHKQWQPLITDAYALSGSDGKRRRDFSSDEIAEGRDIYYKQSDNLSGKATFRLHVLSSTADRLVFETENISTMRYLLVPLFHPGDVQAIYFLERESPDVWRYYSIVRIGRNSSTLAAGHEASAINRAVAFYRFLAGIPAASEPPAAR